MMTASKSGVLASSTCALHLFHFQRPQHAPMIIESDRLVKETR